MSYLVKIVGLASGSRTPYDGMYLKEYDPDRHEDTVPGLLCHLVTTNDPDRAMKFEDLGDFQQLYASKSKKMPTQPNGKPNRPLAAFTVEITRV